MSRAVSLLCIALLCIPRLAPGADIPFPKNPSTFEDRAQAVITFLACGDETQFDQMVSQLKQGKDYDPEGEPLTSLVIAKIEALGNGCTFTQTQTTNAAPPAFPADSPSACAQPIVNASGGQFKVGYFISPACLRQQINTALSLYKKVDQPGSTGALCIPVLAALPFLQGVDLVSTVGEYDVKEREFLRALFLAARRGSPLDPGTVSHIIDDLLIIRGEPGPEDYSLVYDCGDREDSEGSPQEYADQKSWTDRAIGSLGRAVDNIFKRFLLLLAIFYLGPLAFSPSMSAAPPTLLIDVQPAAAATAAVEIVDAFPGSRLPESENHRLMIESSRFLTNQIILDSLKASGHPNMGVIQNYQNECKQWLLQRLQRIAKQDFDEYNSRSYTRYSLNAVLNLYDFSEDPDVTTAAQIVLDYLSAKGALSSNLGRRYAPYRRLHNNDGTDPTNLGPRDLYYTGSGNDTQVLWQLMQAGQTQLLDQPTRPTLLTTPLSEDQINEAVNYAVTSYRMPAPILDIATGRYTYMQYLHHAGVEIYSSAPSYLLSAGGIRTPSANEVFGLGWAKDRGVAMPTVLMPTDGGTTIDTSIRFDGVGVQDDREQQVCVYKGFACGKNLVIPDSFNDCSTTKDVGPVHWTFIKSPGCMQLGLANGSHFFYAAAAQINCPTGHCDNTNNFGIVEVVEAPNAKTGDDPAFDQFMNSRPAALTLARSDWESAWGTFRPTGTYMTSDGTTLMFDAIGSSNAPPLSPNLGQPPLGIMEVNGNPQQDSTNMPLASGDLIDALGDGLIVITSPKNGAKLFLDFTDVNAPKRSIVP